MLNFLSSMIMLFPLLFFISLSISGCNNNVEGKDVALDTEYILPDSSFRYNLDQPDNKFKLTKKLKEISGLACYDDKWLIAVQDEKGALYTIDIKSGEIEDIIKFSADGDYEGMACKDNVFYALRADGVLFRIKDWHKKKTIKSFHVHFIRRPYHTSWRKVC